jgi:hypothetical protein
MKNVFVTKRNNSNNTVTILHQNVCGLSNKKNDMEIYLNERDNIAHFVCISEHFLNKNSVPSVNLENYILSSHNTRMSKKRGGTLIMSLTNRDTEKIAVCNKLYIEEGFEICGVRDVATNIYIYCCYRSPKDINIEVFMKQCELLLEHAFNKRAIICGDFNIDMIKDNKKRNDFLDLLNCYNFRHLIKDVTFKRNDSQSCIDNFITNMPEDLVAKIEVDHNGLADGHAAIFCEINAGDQNTSQNKNRSVSTEIRYFSENSVQTFRKMLLSLNWHDMSTKNFLEKIINIFDQSFRKKKKKHKLKNRLQIKWISKGIKVASKMKRVLCNINKFRCHASVLEYRANYLNIYRKVIGHAKKLAVQSEISKAKESSNAIWKVVNKNRGKFQCRKQENIILKSHSKMVQNPLEIANIFAAQFDHGTIPSTAKWSSVDNCLKQWSKKRYKEISWKPISSYEISRIIQSMENKNSYGYDEMPITIIKRCVDILPEPLADFFNKCYKSGIFPDELKVARVLPVYKKGVKTDPRNYRPISLLPVLSKIFEKLIKSRLLTHLNEYSIINPKQYGFQKNIGTINAIDSLIDDVVSQIHNRKRVAGLFLDLSSAFDTVDHDILLNKLHFYGFRGHTYQLLQNYLSNRKQFVEIKDIDKNMEILTKSELVTVKRGVPQGSILGPILFIIFTNDLCNYICNIVPECHLTLFADDTSAIVSANSIHELGERTKHALMAFLYWFDINNLKLNTAKTQIMLFKNNSKKTDTLNVIMNGAKIDVVECVKFLGVRIDSALNWKQELESIQNAIHSACYALRSLRDDLTVGQLRTVYYALVESRLRYSIMFWGNSYLYNINKALVAQKRAIRSFLRLPQRASCREHFKNLRILTVPSLYVLVLLTVFVKNISKYETSEEQKLRLLTRTKNLKPNFCPKNKIEQHCTRNQAVKMFNMLPINLKMITNDLAFSKKLKAYLLRGCFYSIEEIFAQD